ncbi:MAG: HAMP domain-containing histidine kinase [Desulfobacterales bacterium]|nr:HAMP domain-containing histidine kinase [Desulfobacterales bacterium]
MHQANRWFFHPVFIFIVSILALTSSLILYIYWYLEANTGIQLIVHKFNIDSSQILKAQTWLVILILSMLVALILIGIFLIFVYNQKTFQLYRLQNNFINNFTHELKTPVTSLKLFLETFAKHELPRETQLKYIEFMLQDTIRLSDNISRILNLAKLESKVFDGNFEILDIFIFISDFVNKNNHLFQKCEVNIIKVNENQRVFYKINQGLFEMFLMNIFTNAIKYNKSQTPKIEVEFEIQDKKLLIHFIDNGIGIEKKELKKIFKKFYQIGQSDNMSAKGTGIGLYIAQSVAKAHKGKLIAESKGAGTGSVFSLILPLTFKKNL